MRAAPSGICRRAGLAGDGRSHLGRGLPLHVQDHGSLDTLLMQLNDVGCLQGPCQAVGFDLADNQSFINPGTGHCDHVGNCHAVVQGRRSGNIGTRISVTGRRPGGTVVTSVTIRRRGVPEPA